MSSLATRLRVPVAVAAASALLAGCGAITGDQGGGGREVVASFYPLAWVTERVAGDGWTVTNLTSPGGEPHDLELSIDATASLTEADLVVYLEQFQPAVDDAVDTNVEGATLEAGGVVDLQPVADHSEEGHAHEEEHAEDEESHDHGDLDPHFWQDPARMAVLARAVADELAALDQAGADTYRANAEELAVELEALDREYADGLADCERDVVVVSHDAFGYLAGYGLHLEPIAGLTPDAEPSPAVLADLSDLIREEGLTTVFSERLASPAMAETLASDLGVTTGVLDPVEGLADETAEEDYLSLMRANLAALEEANGC
ncbi:metal ABC transporter substrate-binding protein [Nocardioides euryhalodurans]|uniref:Zinc ABC transporter substrate-binding protein n=1 Tax=Nocardioides euryhalodurans TaxID=2518370 RepID=A0A4P7GIF3_9ACTN|nr:metal ABC transporter substrate-binding protein [Nocardioides euryhalodurans]QBR91613.1 zinc ABC transporter substrate-binding protein [Nocardioides euryhalodurans]